LEANISPKKLDQGKKHAGEKKDRSDRWAKRERSETETQSPRDERPGRAERKTTAA